MASISALLDMKCLLCKKAFNFSEDLLNKVVECPHCKEPVRCRVDVQTVEPRSETSAPWTRKQKLLTAIGLQAFLIPAIYAPWEVKYFDNGAVKSAIFHEPITGISLGAAYQVEHATLQTGPLFATWITIAVVYIGLLKLFRAVNAPQTFRLAGFAMEVVMVVISVLLFLVITLGR